MKNHITPKSQGFKNTVLIVLFFCLSAADCDFDGHFSIYIKNESNDTIVPAFLSTRESFECKLVGRLVKKDEVWEYDHFRNSLEMNLRDGSSIKIYIIDPYKYNEPTIFYKCDSIEYKNKILKVYDVTLAYLQKHDFTVTYP